MTTQKQTDIVEGNKLIGDFMGKDYKDPLNYMYDKSWAWLMPVVEKIEGKEIDLAVSVVIKNNACRVYRHKGSIYEQTISELHNTDSKIKSTWLAVIEFIKYYNQSK